MPVAKKIITNSPEETREVASKFAEQILQNKSRLQSNQRYSTKSGLGRKAVVLALKGNLGAGKTTFLQGFAKGLGIEEKVLSPTFILMRRFDIQDLVYRNFYHIDCYRLKNEKDLDYLGFEEMLKNPENIIAIEWPERIKKVLPKDISEIKFSYLQGNKRKLEVR